MPEAEVPSTKQKQIWCFIMENILLDKIPMKGQFTGKKKQIESDKELDVIIKEKGTDMCVKRKVFSHHQVIKWTSMFCNYRFSFRFGRKFTSRWQWHLFGAKIFHAFHFHIIYWQSVVELNWLFHYRMRFRDDDEKEITFHLHERDIRDVEQCRRFFFFSSASSLQLLLFSNLFIARYFVCFVSCFSVIDT